MEFTRVANNTIYSRRALADTRQAFREFCQISASPGTIPDTAEITVEVKEQYVADGRKIILEAWNYMLDRACQIRFEQAA